jgi:glycosyltransferase involved in cell wall biosynthesis
VPSTDIVYGTLKYLLENPDEAKAMGEKGLYRAKELYSLDLICKKWFDLLEKK